MFWVGEPAAPDNGFIANTASVWQSNWQAHFGGVDDPDHRKGYRPAAFTPHENPFYFALPYSDYDAAGNVKDNVTKVPWYDPAAPPKPGVSVVKNHWIKVTYRGRSVFGQWEDAGPYGEDDVRYVFGDARPRAHVGLDLSPAMADYLRLPGLGRTTWRFVPDSQVPAGPWRDIVTTSQIDWR